MRKLIYCLGIVLMAIHSYAQNIFIDSNKIAQGVKKTQLPVVYLPVNVTIHFVSPEPIQYTDISTDRIVGDLPIKNVLRIKQVTDTSKKNAGALGDDAVVTIAGEKFIAQYRVVFVEGLAARETRTDIDIVPSDMRPLEIAGIGLSEPQLRQLALDIFATSTAKPREHTKAFGIRGTVNHIYTAGDYLFIDLGFRNNTRLRYEIDDFHFSVDDKKKVKAANEQSIELKPELALFDNPSFAKYYRNVFVFKKLSFPGDKVLRVEMGEKQLSGRIVTLDISYKDVLEADILPN